MVKVEQPRYGLSTMVMWPRCRASSATLTWVANGRRAIFGSPRGRRWSFAEWSSNVAYPNIKKKPSRCLKLTWLTVASGLRRITVQSLPGRCSLVVTTGEARPVHVFSANACPSLPSVSLFLFFISKLFYKITKKMSYPNNIAFTECTFIQRYLGKWFCIPSKLNQTGPLYSLSARTYFFNPLRSTNVILESIKAVLETSVHVLAYTEVWLESFGVGLEPRCLRLGSLTPVIRPFLKEKYFCTHQELKHGL